MTRMGVTTLEGNPNTKSVDPNEVFEAAGKLLASHKYSDQEAEAIRIMFLRQQEHLLNLSVNSYHMRKMLHRVAVILKSDDKYNLLYIDLLELLRQH